MSVQSHLLSDSNYMLALPVTRASQGGYTRELLTLLYRDSFGYPSMAEVFSGGEMWW